MDSGSKMASGMINLAQVINNKVHDEGIALAQTMLKRKSWQEL